MLFKTLQSEHIIWHESTNVYSFVDSVFYEHLRLYEQSSSETGFRKLLKDHFVCDDAESSTAIEVINHYLQQCSTQEQESRILPPPLKSFSQNELNEFQYRFGQLIIRVGFNSDNLIPIFHPLIQHCSLNADFYKKQTDSQINLILDGKYIHLYRNQEPVLTSPFKEYHHIQGKLILEVLNAFHSKEEQDWLGFFHASAVLKNNKAVMFVGPSGSGKSTLVSLLHFHGFSIIADDIVPMAQSDQKVYGNPTAVSIKPSSQPILSAFIQDFEQYPKGTLNKKKGEIRYVPLTNNKRNHGFECNTIILVNYQEQATNRLELSSAQNVLEPLITESWISHKESCARDFMDWLDHVNFYTLNYNDFEKILPFINALV